LTAQTYAIARRTGELPCSQHRQAIGLNALATLGLSLTRVTDAGVAALNARWPGIKVVR